MIRGETRRDKERGRERQRGRGGRGIFCVFLGRHHDPRGGLPVLVRPGKVGVKPRQLPGVQVVQVEPDHVDQPDVGRGVSMCPWMGAGGGGWVPVVVRRVVSRPHGINCIV